MIIALFGATGGTGREVLRQGLALGHVFRVLVRDPGRLDPVPDGVSVVVGDVLDRAAVDDCLRGTDAVICTLGSRGGKVPVEDRGTAVILAGMRDQGPRRLVVVTSMGVGDSITQVAPLFRLIMRLTLKQMMAAKEEQERLVRASGLDWTIVRPGGLTDGPRTDRYRSGTEPDIRATRISRADVAAFLLEELVAGRYTGRTPAISRND